MIPDEEKLVQALSLAIAREAAVMPAPWANKFQMSMTSGNVRIAFCEQSPSVGIVVGRSAVTISPEDAIEMAKMIASFVKEGVKH